MTAAVAVAFVASMLVLTPSTSAQPPRCFGQPATIIAQPGQRTFGTQGPDVIIGTRGADIINGRGGNDRICSLGGNDRVIGGFGDDRVNLGGGNDQAIGGRGNDRLLGRGGSDVLRGGPGNDNLNGGPGRDTCRQSSGDGPVRNCERPQAPPDDPNNSDLSFVFADLTPAVQTAVDELCSGAVAGSLPDFTSYENRIMAGFIDVPALFDVVDASFPNTEASFIAAVAPVCRASDWRP